MGEKVILDVDVGIDDAVAIALALASPELDVLGITTVAGNTTLDKVSANALRVLAWLGRMDVPVYRGAAKPLLRELVTSEHVHGSDGLGDCGIPYPELRFEGEPAHRFITREAMRRGEGEVTLITTGPLTNAALAYLSEPGLASRLKGHIMMGGAYGLTEHGYGNVTPVSEFNAYVDPEAARVVFDSGVELRCVGLDVTQNPSTFLTKERIERLKERGKGWQLVYKVAKKLIDMWGFVQMHDPLAVFAAIRPDGVKLTQASVSVSLSSDFTRGMTAVDKRRWIEKAFPGTVRRPNCKVVVDVHAEVFLKELEERLASY